MKPPDGTKPLSGLKSGRATTWGIKFWGAQAAWLVQTSCREKDEAAGCWGMSLPLPDLNVMLVRNRTETTWVQFGCEIALFDGSFSIYSIFISNGVSPWLLWAHAIRFTLLAKKCLWDPVSLTLTSAWVHRAPFPFCHRVSPVVLSRTVLTCSAQSQSSSWWLWLWASYLKHIGPLLPNL